MKDEKGEEEKKTKTTLQWRTITETPHAASIRGHHGKYDQHLGYSPFQRICADAVERP